jgi:hypothetical protein
LQENLAKLGPGKCRFFMWLVAHKNCWTADILARKEAGKSIKQEKKLWKRTKEAVNGRRN